MSPLNSGAQVPGLLAELKEQGWTYSAIARAIRVPRRTLSDWRKGTHSPGQPEPIIAALIRLQGEAPPKRTIRYSEEELDRRRNSLAAARAKKQARRSEHSS